MAVVDNNSTVISNRDSSPKVLNDSHYAGGFVREITATIEVGSGDSVGSIYRMFPLPSNCRVSELVVDSDDIGTTTVADIGLYETTENGSAAKDVDLFASALSLKDGALSKSDQTNESGVIGIDEPYKQLWEHAGDSTDPKKDYDVCLTLTGAADAAGTVTLTCRYIV